MDNRFIKTVLSIIVLSIFCVCMQDYSYGGIFRGGHKYRKVRVLPSGHITVVVKRNRYYYHRGMFFRKSRAGFIIVAPPIGAIVPVLPAEHVILVFGGIPYYCFDSVYYRECPSGYLIVPESEIEEKKKAEDKEEQSSEKTDKNDIEEDFVVNIPNSDGSFTPVKLKKHKNGYIGPQGEYYPDRPTVKQLQVLYGN